MTDTDPAHEDTAAGELAPGPFPRWARDLEHGLVGGVAAGLAGALALDVAVVRIAFVVAGLLHGAGILAYLAAWCALPSLGAARSGQMPPWWREAAGFLLGVAALLVLVQPFDVGSASLLPLLLIGVGIALWQSMPLRWTPPPRPERPPAGSIAEPPAGPLSGSPALSLGGLTVGAAVLAVGTALLLDRTGVIVLTAGRAAALALVVLGSGMVVGTVVGNARWLAVPALLLTPVTAALVTFDRMGLEPFGPAGSVWYTAHSAADLPRLADRGAGNVVLDLSALDLHGASRSLTAETAMGQIIVWLPQDSAVTVDAEVGAGGIDLGTAATPDGVDSHLSTVLPGRSGAGTLHLHLRAGVGSVEVRRGPPEGVLTPVPPVPPAPPVPPQSPPVPPPSAGGA